MKELKPSERDWRALRPAWLIAGMALAPVIPAALSAPIVWLAIALSGHPWPSESVAKNVAGYLLVAEAWALVVGLPAVWVMSRVTDRLSRKGCLLPRALGAFTAPFVDLLLDGSRFELGLIEFMGSIGLFAIPFGVVGGWIFWRIAAYPACPTQHRS
jgi:hypothetical protein